MKVVHSLCLMLLCCLLNSMNAQTFVPPTTQIGVDVQAYPAGMIYALTLERTLAPKHALNARVGYNLARRGRLSGLHEDESGGGFGVSLGYRYYFKHYNKGLVVGLRNDFWWLRINWENTIEDGVMIGDAGTTKISVVQPTFEIGYRWTFANGNFSITPMIINGIEINTVTEGDVVGQGWITLIGLSAGCNF